MSAEGSNLTPTSLQEAVATAMAAGFEVVHGHSRLLTCDLDTSESRNQFHRVYKAIGEHWGFKRWESWHSKSNKLHIIVHLDNPLPIEERLFLQAALGSDGVREALGMEYVKNGVMEPCVLFKPSKKK